MKYVVLKNSQSVLSVQLPDGFGSKMEIICFENQMEFDNFLDENPVGVCQISFPHHLDKTTTEQNHFVHDGFFVRQNDFFKKILFINIMWIEASRSYCYIHMTDNSNIIITYPMAEVKKKLPPDLFIQTHRSYIVNAKFVNKYVGNAVYIDNQSFPISRKFKKKVLENFLFLDNIKLPPDEDENPFGNENQSFGKRSNPN